jgi:hypothetical protein
MMTVPVRFAALATSAPRRGRPTAITRFLTEIWNFDPRSYTMLYTRPAGTDRMRPYPIRGDRARKIDEVLDRYPPETHDIYFCPNPFDAPYNKKERALPTRYAWADIDDADPEGFKPKPNILWETSTGRYQGLWIWDNIVPAREAERYAENLWQLYGGDRGAWAANKLLRVPGTVNHKPERKGERIRLLRFDDRPKRVPDTIRDMAGPRNTPETAGDIDPLKHDPETVMRRYRRRMGLVAGTLMMATRMTHKDRSAAVACIIAKLVELGADNDEIACVLWVNVYFNAKWEGNLAELGRQIVKIRTDVEAGR